MDIEMITETDDVSVYKGMDGIVCTVVRQRFTEDPEDTVNDYRFFAYAELGFSGVTGFKPFDTILDYGVANEEFPTTEELPELFSGGLCRSFKCEGWEDHDFRIEDDIAYCVSKEFGTAEEWSRYYKLYQEDVAWRVIDLDKRSETCSIYEETADEGLYSYLKSGVLASLDRKVQKIVGRSFS